MLQHEGCEGLNAINHNLQAKRTDDHLRTILKNSNNIDKPTFLLYFVNYLKMLYQRFNSFYSLTLPLL